ncbi:hypothetical protein [Roseisolibacter agri]|uniref:Uncharacterized protein n=1 Tax=Roseisolibacter agri TaxID=2014610 RepID=A0AA37QFL7_9BACT|nr:hypothetical protein [Roseisolibacter agri]GLC25908.1 hypothetical protein rosag_24210 [Roseisolibacter agri]
MRLLRHTVGACLAATLGCRASETPPTPDTARHDPSALTVALVDSVPYENELTNGFLRRVEVRTPAHTDTLLGILVDARPVVLGDSVVHGIRAEENLFVELFTYDARTRRTRTFPTPADWVPHAVPKLAPDGRHVAYLAQDAQGQGHGAVATVPDGRVVYRGPPATMLETDAGVDAITWTDADRFEIRIDLTYQVGGTQRLRGTLRPLRVDVDTLRPLPAR